jgi:dTDP-4-dehydrorhamnose 3,5-epimerase
MAMIEIQKLPLSGACVLKPARHADGRGTFCEYYNRREFQKLGLSFDFVQDNASHSQAANTIRGLHFQAPPADQAKLVWVCKGAVQDVIVDLRRSSPTYGQHLSVELSESNGLQLLIPRGFAHGLRTIAPDTLVQYKVDAHYDVTRDFGVRWNDPDLGIAWNCSETAAVLSEKDRRLPWLRDLPAYFP